MICWPAWDKKKRCRYGLVVYSVIHSCTTLINMLVNCSIWYKANIEPYWVIGFCWDIINVGHVGICTALKSAMFFLYRKHLCTHRAAVS